MTTLEKMNLKDLGKKVKHTQELLNTAEKIERRIKGIEEGKVDVYWNGNGIESFLSVGTRDVIKTLVLKDLNDKLEQVTDELTNHILGGKVNE